MKKYTVFMDECPTGITFFAKHVWEGNPRDYYNKDGSWHHREYPIHFDNKIIYVQCPIIEIVCEE